MKPEEDNIYTGDTNTPVNEDSSQDYHNEEKQEGTGISNIMSSINDLYNTFNDPPPQTAKENVFTPLFDDEISE